MAWSNRGKYNTRSTYQKKEPIPFKRPTFAPSEYQLAIVKFVENESRSLIVDAVAGSGKTSTLALIVAAVLDMRRSYVVVAFNRPIATELQDRGMNGRTFHSLGFAAVMNALRQRNGGIQPEMNAQKVDTLVDNIYNDAAERGYASVIKRLVSLAKNHMMSPSDATDSAITSLIEHFDIEWDDTSVSETDMAGFVRTVLTANNADTRTIDFDDQLYFVHLYDLQMPKFDFVLVDESQDTNPLRRSLVRRMMHARSRIVAVGDERQAIYGFTGASHDSMDLIAADFDCARLPLSVSYRCSRAVVALAQTIVPHILPRDDAPDGSVLRPVSFKRSDFLPTDLIVCRNTAPLVSVAYKMLASRVPCKIMGREIGKSLTSLIRRLTRKNETLESLYERLVSHRSTETDRAIKQKKEAKAQAVQDKVDAILAILDSFTPEDTDGGIPRLLEIIEGKKVNGQMVGGMFSDTANGCTTLATVHKSKGLEAPRVLILDSHLMPSKMAKLDWQIAQERNLQYVAYTRALDTLVFIESKKLTD